jgi:DNA primase
MLDEFGCTHVIIMFDGDSSGRTAAKRLKEKIDKYGIKASIVDLPDELDPGMLTKSDADFLLSNLH